MYPMAVFRNLYNLTFCFISCRLVTYTIDFFTNLILNEASFSYSVTLQSGFLLYYWLHVVAHTINFFTNLILNEALFSGTKNEAKNRCRLLTILTNIRMDRVGQSCDCVVYL